MLINKTFVLITYRSNVEKYVENKLKRLWNKEFWIVQNEYLAVKNRVEKMLKT